MVLALPVVGNLVDQRGESPAGDFAAVEIIEVLVKVGDQVGPDTVVCIVEAMKVFNEIPAECSGRITAVLVENAAAVEYGQKLYRVEKT